MYGESSEEKLREVITRFFDGNCHPSEYGPSLDEEMVWKLIQTISNKIHGNTTPWFSLASDGWTICGMNHYNLHGKRHLFVSMTKDAMCITSEGLDEMSVFRDLEKKAEEANR